MTNNATPAAGFYVVVDLQTQMVVATARSAKRARAIRERKDLEYGAVRYVVREAQS